MPSILPIVIPSQVDTVGVNLPKPYGLAPSFMLMPYIENPPMSWNAVLVGLLSCLTVILFLLSCLHYFVYRRRYDQNVSDDLSTPAVEKNSATLIQMTVRSATETTSLLKENTKTDNEDTGNGHLPNGNSNNN